MPQPDRLSPAPATTLAGALDMLRADREHGASWLAREAARALAAASRGGGMAQTSALESARRIRQYALELAWARASMAALANTVAAIYEAGWPSAALAPSASEAEEAAALARLHAAAVAAVKDWEGAASAITQAARSLIIQPVPGAILTHSRSGTVEQVLTALAASDGAGREVIVTTSQPGGEGIATARALGAAGWHVTLIADAAAGLSMEQVRCVVLGADSVRADGALVNKIGSYPIALAARAAHIPVYVLCESLKIAPANWPLMLEEMDPSEILPQPIAGVTARNAYFDVTPPRLINAIITERGVMDRRAIRRLARQAQRRLDHLIALSASPPQ